MQERLACGHAMGIDGRNILNPRKIQVRLAYGHAMGSVTREILNPRKTALVNEIAKSAKVTVSSAEMELSPAYNKEKEIISFI